MSLKKIFCCTLYLILLSNPAYAFRSRNGSDFNLIVGAAAGAITFASYFGKKLKIFQKILIKRLKISSVIFIQIK